VAQANEAERLNALRQLNLLDTAPSSSFDRITRMASQLFGLPIAAVSLTDSDRQWFKSRVGVDHRSIPRDKAPCAQVADFAVPVVIPDMLRDPIYQSSPLAHGGVRFYAGAPLMTRQGYCLGAMCVLGMEARESSAAEMTILGDLAAMVMDQIELQHALGRIDPISGLPNRVQFAEDLEDLSRDGVPGRQRYLVLVDLASPDQVDAAIRVMGSDHLDSLLLEASHTITEAIGPGRRAYHVAATQVVFLARPDLDEQSLLVELEAQVGTFRSAISTRIYVTAAIGVAPFIEDAFSPIDVLRMAHNAAQDARECGARVGLYSRTVDERHRRRYTIINDITNALASSDQLSLVYQPRVDIASGACHSVEALLRWQHPELAEISPTEFVPMVERTPMVMSVTAWVIDAALRQWSEWNAAGLDVQISVNVSAANLEEADFLDRLQDLLTNHNVPPSRLELEVTESAVLVDVDRALALLRQIAAIGVRIAIDDFGTGYSSLSYLQQLPANVVKIDQSFMIDLDEDARKQSLVKTMIGLGHEFGFRVVAEGVESDGVLCLLAAAGCDEAQGYLFARPMLPAAFAAWRSAPRPVTA
jgi:EAL domain-containing protein (putative c-di-GMP-specific phosphodiesterase class I)/GGDEF domain-containing protein